MFYNYINLFYIQFDAFHKYTLFYNPTDNILLFPHSNILR